MLNPMNAVRGLYSFFRLVRDMRRTDEVFKVLGSFESDGVVQPIIDHLTAQPGGAEAMARRARVNEIDLQALAKLPEGTLGRTYADHMITLGLDPYFYPKRDVKTDADYVRAALEETHDIWHVLTGFATDVPGELGLQAFYAAQLRVGFLPPVLLAAGMLNAAFFDLADVGARFDAVSRGWRMGVQTKSLFGTPWAELWSRPIAELRAEFGIEVDRGNVNLPKVATYGVAFG